MSTATKTVTSPAGETITIQSDEEWLAAIGQSEKALHQWNARGPILSALWHHGNVTDKSGRATIILFETAKPYGYKARQATSLNAVFNEATFARAITIRNNGKRRHFIGLHSLPESWYQRLTATPAINGKAVLEPKPPDMPEPMPADQPMPEPETEPAHVDPPAVAEDEYMPPVQLEIASSVAMALLTQVVEIISSGSPAVTDATVQRLTHDLEDARDKLAKRLAENDSLRRANGIAASEVQALTHERDGLRKRLRAAEYNLERATNVDTQRIVNEQVQAELAKFMQAKPANRAKGE